MPFSYYFFASAATLRYVDFGLFRVTAQLFFTKNIKYLFEIAILVLFLCVRVLLCGLGGRAFNLLLQLFLCCSFITGLLNNMHANTYTSLNVYRIPTSAVILKSSSCFALRVQLFSINNFEYRHGIAILVLFLCARALLCGCPHWLRLAPTLKIDTFSKDFK